MKNVNLKIVTFISLFVLILSMFVVLAGCGGSSPTTAGGGGGGGITIPTAPAIASAAAGNTQNTITWGNVVGATSYKIYFATNSTGSTSAQIRAVGTVLNNAVSPYAHTGLINGITYSYVVTATNAAGESNPSNVVSAAPTAAAAPAPTVTSFAPTSGVIGATVTITGTNFSATPVNNIVTFNGTAATVTAATTTSLTVTVPNGATTGLVSVSVAGQAGTSAGSFTVLVPPTTPTGVTASTSTNANTIAWSPAAGATSYNIYWATNSTASTSAQIRAGGTLITGVTSPYNHTALTTNTKYSYVVTTVNAVGESAPSAVVSVMPNNIYIWGDIIGFTGGMPAVFIANGITTMSFGISDVANPMLPVQITNATVTVNGTSVPLNAAIPSQYGTNNIAVTPGATYTVNITIPGDPNTYTATGTMYSSYPVVTAPTANFVWSAAAANTVTWTQGSPAVGRNDVAVFTSTGIPIYWPLTSTMSTISTIPAGSTTATPAVVTTVGISQNVPIINAGAGTPSFVTFQGYAAPVAGTINP